MVEPIVAALAAEGLQAEVRYVEGDDPARAINDTADEFAADMLVMGATRRLFTEEAWRSVSSRVMEQSQRPMLLVPGPRIEDTFEMPRLEI